MKTTLNINVDPATMMTVAASLNNSELGRLFRALTARMTGEDPEVYLNNSGLRLAFALLYPSIDDSLQRLALNRANGAKGGRPRKHPVEPVETQNFASPIGDTAVAVCPVTQNPASPIGDTAVVVCPVTQNPASPAGRNHDETLKKSKKEDLPPTPPIEEKNKKNNNITLSPREGANETQQRGHQTVTLSPTVAVPELEELQEQMLREQPWLDELCMSRHISQADMAMYVMDFIAYLRERDMRETLSRAKVHFVNQLPYILKIYKTNHNHEKQNSKTYPGYIADPVARRKFEQESRRREVCLAIAEVAAESQRPAVLPF